MFSTTSHHPEPGSTHWRASPEDEDWSLSFQAAGQGDKVAEVGLSRSYPSHKYRGGAVRVEGGHWSFLDPGLQR